MPAPRRIIFGHTTNPSPGARRSTHARGRTGRARPQRSTTRAVAGRGREEARCSHRARRHAAERTFAEVLGRSTCMSTVAGNGGARRHRADVFFDPPTISTGLPASSTTPRARSASRRRMRSPRALSRTETTMTLSIASFGCARDRRMCCSHGRRVRGDDRRPHEEGRTSSSATVLARRVERLNARLRPNRMRRARASVLLPRLGKP